MPSFRIRVRSTEIDLPAGELTIGRATECFLRVDDDLVSRRHARLFVNATSVVFEDLGSRNGSRVNGEAVNRPTELRIGDTFEIGTQTFQVLRGGESHSPSTKTMLAHRPCQSCRLLIATVAATCPHCGAPQRTSRSEMLRPGADDFEESTRVSDDPPPFVESTKSFENTFKLVSGLGDKLLSLGRTDEAERMIGPRLRDVLARVRAGEEFSGEIVGEALRRGARLAAITANAEWYSWIFEFAGRTGRRLDDALLDELHANMMVHKPAAADAVRAYAAAYPPDDAERGPHRRRLDGLLRFCRE